MAITGGNRIRIKDITKYWPWSGNSAPWNVLEVAEHPLPFRCQASRLTLNISGVKGGANLHVSSVIDGAVGNQYVHGTGVGQFVDLSGFDIVPRGAKVSTLLDGGGGNDCYVQSVSYAIEELEDDEEPDPVIPPATRAELADFIRLSESMQQVPVIDADDIASLPGSDVKVNLSES